MKPERPPPISGVVKTMQDVADAFGVAHNTVAKDWKNAGMPGRMYHYDLAEIAEWKKRRPGDCRSEANRKNTEPGYEADVTLRKRLAETRCKEAEALKREMDNLIRQKAVVPREDVVLLFTEMILMARKRLLQLPERLMMMFPSDQRIELTNEVRRQVELVLTEMADQEPTFEETKEENDDGDPETPEAGGSSSGASDLEGAESPEADDLDPI
jgi:phage terminase Nu1 subunit (DNA packaging protein)